MKQVDYEHFGRFLCPHTLNARGNDLYFCEKRVDFEENCYHSDLFRLREGTIQQLTSSGDLGEYHLLERGIVFASLREKKDKETAEKGVPLTVLQCLPYNGGEAVEYLRLPYRVTSLRFLNEDEFFFTAACSRAFDAALKAADGDAEKAAEACKADADYRVLDEVPFVSNGSGYVNGLRNRLFRWRSGKITPVTDENTAVTMMGLSQNKKVLWFSAETHDSCAVFFNRLYAMETDTLRKEDISVTDRAIHFDVFELADGRLAALASLTKHHGVNENPAVFLRENEIWRCTYQGGAHSFQDSLCADIEAERTMRSDTPLRDGKLYLTDTQENSVQIIALDPVSGEFSNVTTESGRISELIAYRDGFAMAAMRGNGGPEIYALSPDGRETQLTNLNTALCAEYNCSTPQHFTFQNENGTELHGWVIPPVGQASGKKYPTILDIHGGPKTVYGDIYFHEMQLWANRGFAVLYCNPSGGDGRGDEFLDIFGDYGGQDYRDIMTFVDEALRRFPFLDEKRLGVTGGSYGGFMTNWIIGHTNRFCAAASQRSISNWTSFYGTSDIGYFFQPDQTGADPWQDIGAVWAQSPLKYADRVRTPTLFIHSDEDYRCPLTEGLQMFTALRTHGVEARLCMFKGENHELSRSGKPKHRVRRLKEITEWMETHL